ncbi:MAG: nicotinate-nicotinamide nucleotide adenylyltransferase [Candidatus Nucleicultricaceae bacterium]|jgi:nicotinate-nucleotide adenylyltransferase
MLTSILFSILIASSSAHALVLEDMETKGTLTSTLAHKKVGYYIGSFDPLHKGHESVAHQIVDTGLCDYVLVVPAWSTADQYKNRSAIEHRLDMLFAAFEANPKIIVTRKNPKQIQQALTEADPMRTIHEKATVKASIPGITFVGIIGSDVVMSTNADERKRSVFMEGVKISKAHKDTSVGTVMALPVKEFIVSMREGDDLSTLGGKLGDRPIIEEIKTPFKDLSSTKIRELIKAQKPINDFVSDGVRGVIEHYHLYTHED